jgi:hypothetical protein
VRPQVVLAASLLLACSGESVSDQPDLGVGEIEDGYKADDGGWGDALNCKAVPDLPALAHPEITISLDGLTLHLVDRSVGFDKVFPVGVGQIEADETSENFGESKSYWPLGHYGRQDYAITPSSIQTCKIWWTDPDTGEQSPVFAGMPFLSWSGSYGIHGPIDNFRAPNGGSLRRGYVSHGCVRMESAGILEVYARIKGVARVPVHVQREPERRADGSKVDLETPWIGAECSRDADCSYAGGFCKANAFSRRGVCSARCTPTSADRAGQPTTFCVADPQAPGQGMCVAKHSSVNAECRPYDHLVPKTLPRNDGTASASVCVPGSRGWVGDRCLAASDCTNGATCGLAGVCTMACTQFCADMPGFADTFCVRDASLGSGGSCVRTCTPGSNASECAAGMTCAARGRNGAATPVRNVCVPN